MATKPSSFGNSALSNAKRAKNDEFYTQWADIEREMNAYLEYDLIPAPRRSGQDHGKHFACLCLHGLRG